MIVHNEVSPLRSLYYIGGLVIREISMARSEAVTLDYLRRSLSESQDFIPFAYLLLALDWLYLVGAVDLHDDDRISLCS